MAGNPSMLKKTSEVQERERLVEKAKQERRRLLARGSKVELANGATVELVFTSRAVALIEDEYGSLEDYTDAIKAASRGKMIRNLAFTFHVLLGQPADVVLDLIDLHRLDQYLEAVAAALAEGLPEPTEEQLGNALATPAESPGVASSISLSSNGVSLPEISGE